MDRRDKTNYYLDMAQVALERGTCLRRNFGAVIVKNDVIVSTGYNGAPRGCLLYTSIPDQFGYFRHVGMRRIFNYSIAEQGNILIVVIFVRGETSVYRIFCLTRGTVCLLYTSRCV